jgi:hypothetical protein
LKEAGITLLSLHRVMPALVAGTHAVVRCAFQEAFGNF